MFNHFNLVVLTLWITLPKPGKSELVMSIAMYHMTNVYVILLPQLSLAIDRL